jgi:hypothetical protein
MALWVLPWRGRAVDPRVGGLAADVEAIGELRHRLQAALIIGDELSTLVYR